jgi:hypothetical protein
LEEAWIVHSLVRVDGGSKLRRGAAELCSAGLVIGS